MPRSLGKIRVTPKGEYNSTTQYTALDLVTLEGASYLALQDSKGKQVTETDYWQLVAAQGPKGDSVTISKISQSNEAGGTTTVTFSNGETISITNGLNGETPVRGTNYWTPEDIAEMQSYIDQKVAEAIAAQQPTE